MTNGSFKSYEPTLFDAKFQQGEAANWKLHEIFDILLVYCYNKLTSIGCTNSLNSTFTIWSRKDLHSELMRSFIPLIVISMNTGCIDNSQTVINNKKRENGDWSEHLFLTLVCLYKDIKKKRKKKPKNRIVDLILYFFIVVYVVQWHGNKKLFVLFLTNSYLAWIVNNRYTKSININREKRSLFIFTWFYLI